MVTKIHEDFHLFPWRYLAFRMFTFQRFGAYQKAKQLNIEIECILRNKSIALHTRDQLLRAALSVILNIAEGSGRETIPDRNRFFGIAKGSVMECVAIVDIINTSRKISDPEYERITALADEIIRILFVTMKRGSNR